MFQKHFRISHLKNNVYLLNDGYNEILFDLLNNGYEIHCLCNYLNSNRTLEQWINTDYFHGLEFEIKKEYDYKLIWTNEFGTFIHKYLLFEFGKFLNKTKAWKLMDLIVSSNDEAVNRIRESYQISEAYYEKLLKNK